MSQHIDPEVKQSFIVDNLTTNDAGKALSAAQGKKIFDRLGVSNSPASDSAISSFDDLKTYLNNVASSMTDGNVIALIWYNNFTNANFSDKTYLCGYLYKITNAFFTVNVVGVNGKHFTICRSNTTWYVDSISDEIRTLNSNLSVIGSMVGGANNSKSLSVPTSASTEINSITFTDAGRYLMIGCADWATNATGYRQISFGDGVNPGRNFTSTTVGVSGKETYQQVCYLAIVSAGDTIKLYGIQTSGSTLTVYPGITAIRIQ